MTMIMLNTWYDDDDIDYCVVECMIIDVIQMMIYVWDDDDSHDGDDCTGVIDDDIDDDNWDDDII